MARKKKEMPISEDLIFDAQAFIQDNKDEAEFSDENIFITDTPYVRPLNEKYDENGLYEFQHIVIFHVATLAGYFPDTLYPTTKSKCLKYHTEHRLIDAQIKPGAFIKAYSKYIQIDIENGHRIIPREKFLTADFIEKIMPFIEQWYPRATVFKLLFNTSPHIFKPIFYYWIYLEVRNKFRGSWEDFRIEYCSHIKWETFRTFHKRNSKKKTPDEIKDYIAPFIEFHFSDEAMNS